MTRPLYNAAVHDPSRRPPGGHAGLWFDKFCDRWRVEGAAWTMKSRPGDDGSSPKLDWIDTLTSGTVGAPQQIRETGLRLARLVERRGGRWEVFTTESRFVTGLGNSHPVENGFAWHPTLGTPYLPGSSLKGLVRAWAELDAVPQPAGRDVERRLGDAGRAGGLCFMDAVPIAPVRLEADVMTPHYAGWSPDEPPGDWRSPTPIPFLVTAAGTAFLFGVVPRCRTFVDDDLNAVMDWLRSALSWAGGGAKTAVGYGRFGKDAGKTDELKQRLRDRDRAREKRVRARQEARDREARRALMSPVERQIEDLLDVRSDRNMPEVTAVMQAVEKGRWAGPEKIEAARWLKTRMERENLWKEASFAKNPTKDRTYQRTLRVKIWLGGE